MNILLADDDNGTLVTLKIALSSAGFKVKTVTDGRDALRLLKQEPFDWLITDGHMSPIHGFTIAQEARKLQPKIRTVMISGVCDEKDIEGWPILRLFPKPVDEEKLIAFIQSTKTAA